MKLTENQLKNIIRKTLTEVNIVDTDDLWDSFANSIHDAISNGIPEEDVRYAFESALEQVLDSIQYQREFQR